MSNRTFGKKISIDNMSVNRFFSNRAAKFNESDPFISMLYQDSNPELARERDIFEKTEITPLLALKEKDKVLDVGCGIGRWAEVLVETIGQYHGTDFNRDLIGIAEERFRAEEKVTFQTIAAQDISSKTLLIAPPYNIIIVAGVLQYINDNDNLKILQQIAICSDKSAVVYIRVPIALQQRLTLDRVWSEELKHEYSAIYRAWTEYIELFQKTLFPFGFRISIDRPLYPVSLNNRKETQQHFFILTRSGEKNE